MFKRKAAASIVDDDDDTISLASSQEEEVDPDAEYEVIRILAQRPQDNKYLILWKGYPEEAASWEPKSHISPSILEAWAERKRLISQGIEPAFDVAAFEARCERLAREKADRQRRREEKRKRLQRKSALSLSGSVVSKSDDSDSSVEAAEVDDEIEDALGYRTQVKPKRIKLSRRAVKESTKRQSASSVQQNIASSSSSNLLRSTPRLPQSRDNLQSSRPSSSSSDEPLSSRRAFAAASSKASASSTPGTMTQPPTEVNPGTQPSYRIPKRASTHGGQLSGRGRGAIRGGHSYNVFQGSEQVKKRPNLLQNAADESKKPTLFGNKRFERKAELQGRSLAEREPDASSLGGLYKPSDPSSLRSIRPSTLERPPSTSKHHEQDKPDALSEEMTALSELEPRNEYSIPIICFFWYREKKHGDPPCSKGMRCQYAHFDDGRMTVAMAPIGWTEPSKRDAVDIQVEQQSEGDTPSRHRETSSRLGSYDARSSTCFYWDRGQKEGWVSCTKTADECTYLHKYGPGIPIALPPPGQRLSTTVASAPPQTVHQPHPPITDSVDNKMTCFFWDRQQREDGPPCRRGKDCAFLHAYVVGAPVAMPPPSISRHIDRQAAKEPRASKYALEPSGSLMQPSEEEANSNWQSHSPIQDGSQASPLRQIDGPSAHTDFGKSIRVTTQKEPPRHPASHLDHEGRVQPPWNGGIKNNAICYFWYHNGKCLKEGNCKYKHSNDINLPVAPSPAERKGDTSKITCPGWRNGWCKYNDSCRFAHQTFPNDPLSGSTDLLQPAPGNMANDRHEVDKNTCFFHSREGCRDGASCRFRHEYVPDDRQYQERANDEGQKNSRAEHENILGNSSVARTEPSQPFTSVDRPGVSRARKSVTFAEHHDTGEMHEVRPSSENSANGLRPALRKPKIHNDTEISPPEVTMPEGQMIQQADVVSAGLNKAKSFTLTKLNLADYTSKKALQLPNVKPITFGSKAEQTLTVNFGDAHELPQSTWTSAFSSLQSIQFDHICLASDFETDEGPFKRRELWNGNVVPANKNNDEAAQVLRRVADSLGMRSTVVMFTLPEFAIVLYPARKEKFNFLDGAAQHSANVWLKFSLFVLESSPEAALSLGLSPGNILNARPIRESMVNRLHRLDYKQLIPTNSKKGPHHFYLMFPETEYDMADFIASWLRDSDVECKIYTSHEDGSWDFFANRPESSTGVVLIHESAAADLNAINRLSYYVNKGSLNFWVINDSRTSYPAYPSSLSGIEELGCLTATRLFPYGGVFLLTPSFFVSDPIFACAVLKWFLSGETAKFKTLAGWKMAVCHDTQNWLLNLALAKVREREAHEVEYAQKDNKDAVARDKGLSYDHTEARFLMPGLLRILMLETTGFEDSKRPIVYAPRFVGQDNEHRLVEWFAGWAMTKLDVHKRFLVIGSGTKDSPRAQRWKLQSQDLSGPQSVIGAEQASTSALATSMSNGNPSTKTPKHSIHKDLGPMNLQIMAATGCGPEGAVRYLADAGNDVQGAIDLAEGAVDGIDADMAETNSNELPYLSAGALDLDLERAKEYFAESTTRRTALPQLSGSSDRACSPALPDGTRTGSPSSIHTTNDGHNVVPRSIRRDNSVREHNKAEPGSIAAEDIERYLHRQVVGSRIDSTDQCSPSASMSHDSRVHNDKVGVAPCSTLELGKVYTAQRCAHEKGIRIEVRVGDKCQAIKRVSGKLYHGINLRSTEKGQFSADIFGEQPNGSDSRDNLLHQTSLTQTASTATGVIPSAHASLSGWNSTLSTQKSEVHPSSITRRGENGRSVRVDYDHRMTDGPLTLPASVLAVDVHGSGSESPAKKRRLSSDLAVKEPETEAEVETWETIVYEATSEWYDARKADKTNVPWEHLTLLVEKVQIRKHLAMDKSGI